MVISFIEEAIAAAIIGFIVERIIRKTLSYMCKENNEENLHLEYRPQNTQEEIVIIAEREHNKVFKFSNYI